MSCETLSSKCLDRDLTLLTYRMASLGKVGREPEITELCNCTSAIIECWATAYRELSVAAKPQYGD